LRYITVHNNERRQVICVDERPVQLLGGKAGADSDE
jgi:hypothetical protein